MSMYATSFPGHASPHPTSFCSCSAGTTSDGGGMIWDDLGMTLLLMYIWWYHWMLGFDSDGLLDQLQVEFAPTNSGVLIKWTAKHACLKHFAQKTNESKELFRWVSRLPWGTSVGASLAAAQTCLEYSRLLNIGFQGLALIRGQIYNPWCSAVGHAPWEGDGRWILVSHNFLELPIFVGLIHQKVHP